MTKGPLRPAGSGLLQESPGSLPSWALPGLVLQAGRCLATQRAHPGRGPASASRPSLCLLMGLNKNPDGLLPACHGSRAMPPRTLEGPPDLGQRREQTRGGAHPRGPWPEICKSLLCSSTLAFHIPSSSSASHHSNS